MHAIHLKPNKPFVKEEEDYVTATKISSVSHSDYPKRLVTHKRKIVWYLISLVWTLSVEAHNYEGIRSEYIS